VVVYSQAGTDSSGEGNYNARSVSLAGFAGRWTVSEDGTVVDQGRLEKLDLAPGAEQVVAVPFKPFTPKPGAAYYLRVSFTLANDEPWAKKGYEVAAGQFQLPLKAEAKPAEADALPALQLADAPHDITVTGKGFTVVFDKAAGTISRLVRDQKDLLIAGGGPRLHLWRAAHRNDDMWAYKDWHAYGLDKLEWSVVRIAATQVSPSVVRIESVVRGAGAKQFEVKHSANFTVYGDGTIAVDNAVAPSRNRIPLARLGVRLELDKQLDQFAYLGRGPMENYSDRKRGSDVGLYASAVGEQMTPYAKPMECGNHEDVRWAAVGGKGLPILMAQAERNDIQVSALPYTDEVMFPIEYSVDLPPSKSTVLTVSAHTLGAGSAGCGPQPLEPYMLRSAPATFSYVLRLLPAGQKPAEAGRKLAPQDRVRPAPEALLSKVPRGKVISASSFEPGEGEVEHAVDGDAQTYWHSHWSGGNAAKPPHCLVIDYGQPLGIAGVTYTARTDKDNGHVKDYEVYLSNDGQTWGAPAAKGRIARETTEETIQLRKPVNARYLKFVILSEQNDQPFAAVGELEILPATP